MKLSQPALSLLEETIKQAIGKYACGCEQTVVTDIHLQANQSSGEFSIFDDDDKELASTTIEEWMTYEGDDFYENMERILSNLLCNLKNRGAFDKLTIMKPFSFVLVDDDKETIAELLLLDDDTLLVNEELLMLSQMISPFISCSVAVKMQSAPLLPLLPQPRLLAFPMHFKKKSLLSE